MRYLNRLNKVCSGQTFPKVSFLIDTIVTIPPVDCNAFRAGVFAGETESRALANFAGSPIQFSGPNAQTHAGHYIRLARGVNF